MKNQLLLTTYQDYDAAFLLEEGQLAQISLEKSDQDKIGDIYIGKVKNIAGNTVVLVPAVDDCAVVGGVLGDDEFLILDGDVVLFVVIAGKTDVACGHVEDLLFVSTCFYSFFSFVLFYLCSM